MQTINIGVIGWGFMGKTHTHVLREMPLFYPDAPFRPQLKSLCSRRLEMARQGAEDGGFETFTDDYRQLLQDKTIDAVSICTPNDLHEEMAIEALRAGKHVYLDKPVAVTYESARRIADAAKKAGVVTHVALNNRFWPSTQRAKEIVEEGRLGEILSFSVRYLHSGSVDPARPVGWKQLMQGGVLLDLGSHALDLAQWLCGTPREVFCALRTLYPKRPTRDGGTETNLSDDQAIMLLRMQNGALGTVEASKIATGAEDELVFEICGTKGALRLNLMDPNWLWFYDNTVPDAPYGGMKGYTRISCVARFPAPAGSFLPSKNTIGWDRAHMHCYYTFLNNVARGTQSSPSIEDGTELQYLMECCKQSSETSRWVMV